MMTDNALFFSFLMTNFFSLLLVSTVDGRNFFEFDRFLFAACCLPHYRRQSIFRFGAPYSRFPGYLSVLFFLQFEAV